MTERRARSGDGDKSPFLLRRDGRADARGVLCIHGFSGTPFEMRPLAEGLAQQGFTVLGPLLAGHGDTVAALGRSRWPDWLASAEAGLDELLAETGGAPVGIVGFSLGGLLALRLARLRPRQIAALAVLAAPLRLRPAQARVIAGVGRLPLWLRRRGPLAVIPKLHGFDVTDEEMRKKNPGLEALPLAGALSMMDLGAVVRRDLPCLKVPTLVAHGEKDRTVPMEDSLEIVGTLGSEVIERLWLPQSGHLVAIDVERATLTEAVGRLFARYVGLGRPAGAVAS